MSGKEKAARRRLEGGARACEDQPVNETDILLGIIELASTGKAASPEDAVSHIAVLIGRLDPADEAYEVEFEALLKVGATIWQLAQATG